MDGRDIKPLPLRLLFVLAGFLVGAYSENCSSTVIFAGVCFMLLSRFIKKQKVSPYLWLAILAAFCGFLFMMSAPAEIINKAGQFDTTGLFAGLNRVSDAYFKMGWLFIFYIFLAVFSNIRKINADSQFLSAICFLASLASSFVLIFAKFLPERCIFFSTVLLILADSVLLVELLNELDLKPVILSLLFLSLTFAFKCGVSGVSDILKTNYLISEGERKIIECRENGIMNAEMPKVLGKTPYSAVYGLDNIYVGETDIWLHEDMANYYGVETVMGIY